MRMQIDIWNWEDFHILMTAGYLRPAPQSIFMQLMLYFCLQGCDFDSEIRLVKRAEPHWIPLKSDDSDTHTASACNPQEAE